MWRIISIPLSLIYYLLFGSTLVFFHLLQWICYHTGGYRAHKWSVDWMCFFLVANTYILGTRYRFYNRHRLPNNVPLIVVSNHQSFYDIPAIVWFMRRHHIKFVAKKELGKKIPGISYNLRKGGSVLINRKDPRQALREIRKLGEYIEGTNRSAVIFPEGTRSQAGSPKPFAESGLKILCKYAPSAYVVPISVNNAWKMTRHGTFPMGLGNKLSFTIHTPIAVSSLPFDELFELVEKQVVDGVIGSK